MNKKPFAAIVSATGAVVFITLITLLADLFPPLKDWLKTAFTHHWIGKGFLGIGLYAILYLLIAGTLKKEPSPEKIASQLHVLGSVTIIGSFIILAFFIYEALVK